MSAPKEKENMKWLKEKLEQYESEIGFLESHIKDLEKDGDQEQRGPHQQIFENGTNNFVLELMVHSIESTNTANDFYDKSVYEDDLNERIKQMKKTNQEMIDQMI